MPIGFLNAAERGRLNSFPADIPHADLIAHFTRSAATVSPSDRQQLPITSAAYNRLGFALQLGALRYLGFFPDAIADTPVALVDYVAQQLGVEPRGLEEYGRRAQTRSDHARQIQSYLGFRRATPRDARELEDLNFRSNRPNDSLLAAIENLRLLDREGLRKLPQDAPLGFVPPQWLPYVVGQDGSIDRRYHPLCRRVFVANHSS